MLRAVIVVFLSVFLTQILASGSQPDQRVVLQSSEAEMVQLNPLNTVVFRGEVNDFSVINAIRELAKLDAIRGLASYPIYLVLDSGGGSIDSGMDFINFAKTVRNLKTISIFAASMASAIAEQLPGERLVTGTGTMMFHRAAASFRGYIETGEIESSVAYIKAMVQHLELQNANRIGISIADYKAKVVGEWWIFGAQNIEQKTADRVVNITCTKALLDLEIRGYSGCPLLRVGN